MIAARKDDCRKQRFFLFAVAVTVYLTVINNPFIYDDLSLIVTNARIRTIGIDLLEAAFLDRNVYNIAAGEIYRPFYIIALAAEYRVFSLNPVGYHLINILLHLLVSLALFKILTELSLGRGTALAAAIIFSIHPINTETVTWIKGIDSLLCSLFFLWSAVLYMREEAHAGEGVGARYFLSLILFILALLSKEMAVTLPAIFLVYEILLGRGIRRGILRLIPFAILTVGYLLLRTAVLGQVAQEIRYAGSGFMENFLTSLAGIFYYTRLILFPFNQNADYFDFPVIRSVFSLPALFGGAVVAGLIGLAIRERRRRPVIPFLIAWFFIAILPVSNIIPVKILFAERFLYVPAMGLFALMAYLLQGYKLKPIRCGALPVIFMILMAILTILRNEVWSSPRRLWEDSLQKAPGNARAHANLALLKIGSEPASATDHLQQASRSMLLPSKAFMLMGERFRAAGDYDSALIAFRRAALEHGMPAANRSVGMILQRKGDARGAVDAYERELKIDPDDVPSLVNLSILYGQAGRCAETEPIFRKLYLLKPGDAKIAQVYAQVMGRDCREK